MIKSTVASEGFEGILFSGDGRKDKVIIVISGSNGGMQLTKGLLNSIIKMVFLLWRLLCLKLKVHKRILIECLLSILNPPLSGYSFRAMKKLELMEHLKAVRLRCFVGRCFMKYPV